MKCPFCGYAESKVIDSRPADEGTSIRRRRECLACQRRFTTYETIERLPLVVVKRDGSRQTFDKNKLIGSMLKACEKRSVALGDLERIAGEIEQELQNELEREIPTSEIGEMVMKRLKDLDEVAYVRFASVYRQFRDINTFMEELTRLLEDKAGERLPAPPAAGGSEHAFEGDVLHGVDAVQMGRQPVVLAVRRGGVRLRQGGEHVEKGVRHVVDLGVADKDMGVALRAVPKVQGVCQRPDRPCRIPLQAEGPGALDMPLQLSGQPV